VKDKLGNVHAPAASELDRDKYNRASAAAKEMSRNNSAKQNVHSDAKARFSNIGDDTEEKPADMLDEYAVGNSDM
jgi:hypothetical protein